MSKQSENTEELEQALRRGARAYVFGILKMSDLAAMVAREDVARNLADGKLGKTAPSEEELDRAAEITQRFYMKSASAQLMAELMEESVKIDTELGRVYFPETLQEVDSYTGLADCLRVAVQDIQQSLVTEGEDYLLPINSGMETDRIAAKHLLESMQSKKSPSSVNLGSFEFQVKSSGGKKTLSYDGDLPEHGKRVLSDINDLIGQANTIKAAQDKRERKREMQREASSSLSI